MIFSRICLALAAAGILLLPATSQTQSLGGNPGMIGAPGPNVMGAVPPAPVTPVSPGAPGTPATGPATFAPATEIGALGLLPDQVLTDLELTNEQLSKYGTAHLARVQMWKDNQASRTAEWNELSKELKRGADFDPRAVVAMRLKARTEMQARMDVVQDLWLVFWDSLGVKQRAKFAEYMLAQHERHGRIRRPGP